LLIVLAHGRRMPSATVRALIFLDHMAAAGYSVTILDHYSDLDRVVRGLNRIYPRFSEWRIPRVAARSDIVFLCKVVSPVLIGRIRAQAPRARIVLDFGDAMWLHSEQGPGKFGEMLGLVDAVTTDNEYTASYVRRFNLNCLVVPDCPQIESFDQRRPYLAKPDDGRVVLGWVGSPSTTYNLYAVWEALEQLFEHYPQLELRLVGADPRLLPPFEKVRFTLLKNYDQRRMIDEVLGMHIGLFPLQNTEACRVRGILKSAVYMSGGAVAACSAIGEACDLIRDGINGVLASNTADWVEKVGRLVEDAQTRESIAQAGLATVRAKYTITNSFRQLLRAFGRTGIETGRC
jgi:glycosyltransferase involved in cell wall biosynthesis